MQPFTIKTKDHPKWYEFRTKLANVFIKIARWIKPGNPEMMAYLTEQIVEMELSGMAIRKIDWKEFYKDPETEEQKYIRLQNEGMLNSERFRTKDKDYV